MTEFWNICVNIHVCSCPSSCFFFIFQLTTVLTIKRRLYHTRTKTVGSLYGVCQVTLLSNNAHMEPASLRNQKNVFEFDAEREWS